METRLLLTAVPSMQIVAGSISGIVHSDYVVHDNRWQPGETGLAGVKIELLGEADQIIASTVTDAAGHYRFDGVWPGKYALRESQPVNTFQGGEQLGSGGGQIAANVFRDIEILSGSELTGYNFSEVSLASVAASLASTGKIEQPSPTAAIPFVAPAGFPFAARVFEQLAADDEYFPNSVDGEHDGWRLRVLSLPLTAKSATAPGKLMHQASVQANKLSGGKWLLGDAKDEPAFGPEGATPLVGDFNGDGRADLAAFLDGEWMIDINGNRQWDDDDVAVQHGSSDGSPVVGDWNGDGRDDIGVFSSRQATPIAGDFGGQGRDSIGLFHNGRWHVDGDGDARLTSTDPTMKFGDSGDVPIVGDFDGDGRDEIGVFRHGQWIIDSNHNGQIDAADKVFELGGAGDVPMVGDFNGDGIDEPGVYRGSPAARVSRTP